MYVQNIFIYCDFQISFNATHVPFCYLLWKQCTSEVLIYFAWPFWMLKHIECVHWCVLYLVSKYCASEFVPVPRYFSSYSTINTLLVMCLTWFATEFEMLILVHQMLIGRTRYSIKSITPYEVLKEFNIKYIHVKSRSI